MSTGPHDANRGDRPPDDDPSIVPGLGPVPQPRPASPPAGRLDPALDPDRYDASRDTAVPTGRLDPALDPDRYDPARDTADGHFDALPTTPSGRLDPARAPHRYQPPGQGQSLKDLLGDGAHEDERDNYQWAIGLLAVVAFIALVSFLFGSVLSPRAGG